MEENNIEENLRKKERGELRNEERRQEQKVLQKKKIAKKIIWWIAAVLILAAAAYGVWIWAKKIAPEGKDLSQEYPITSWDHIQDGSVYDGPQYNSNPPTSGPHWSNPLRRGIHDEEQPDERLIHNLEHGEVWISYRPGISAEVIEELEEIARGYNKIVMTPRSKNDADITVASWGRLDKWNLDGKPLDKKRVEDFIVRYLNQGRELVP